MTELMAVSRLSSPEVCLLVLLFAGHIVGDFLVQTRSMVERKHEIGTLSAHATAMVLTHLILVIPFLRWSSRPLLLALTFLLLLGALHALIDYGKVLVKKRSGGDSVRLFVGDQGLHAATIVVVWFLWRVWLGVNVDAGVGPSAPGHLAEIAASALVVSAYVLNGNAAAALIKLFLRQFPVAELADAEAPRVDIQRMGRTIGILERMLVLSLVLLAQWQAIGWLFAGKTVARFRELDNRAFSEYYLIGTLSSLLFAAGTGALVRFLLTGGF